MQKTIYNCATGQEETVAMTQEEIDTAQAVYDAGANQRIVSQIQDIEALITPRRCREATLNANNPLVYVGAASWLEDKDDEIVALRAQLV